MEQISRHAIKHFVESAEPQELNEIVFAVLERFHQLYTDEEVVFLSLPKHSREERQRIIRSVLTIEQQP